MKSFSLLTAFALAVVPLAIADPAPPPGFKTVRFDAAVLGGTIGASPPPDTAGVLLRAEVGDGNVTTFLIPETSTTRIPILPDVDTALGAFCVTGTPPTNRSIATVGRCFGRPQELWTVPVEGSQGPISNEAGLCLTVLLGGARVIFSIPCNPADAGQLWNVTAVSE